MLHRQPAIEKVTGAIGWQPRHSLEEILEDVVQYARSAPALVADEALDQGFLAAAGERMTSQIVSRPSSTIASRSMPMPMPLFGAIPYDIAST